MNRVLYLLKCLALSAVLVGYVVLCTKGQHIRPNCSRLLGDKQNGDCAVYHSKNDCINQRYKTINLTMEVKRNLLQYINETESYSEDSTFTTIDLTFIPAFKLYECALQSIFRLKKMQTKLPNTKLNNQIFRDQLLSICKTNFYYKCCHRYLDTTAVLGYLNYPTCNDVLLHFQPVKKIDKRNLLHLAKILFNNTDRRKSIDNSYHISVTRKFHEEITRAVLFLNKYLSLL